MLITPFRISVPYCPGCQSQRVFSHDVKHLPSLCVILGTVNMHFILSDHNVRIFRIGDQLVRVNGRLIPALIGRQELARLLMRNAAAGPTVLLSLRNDTLQVPDPSLHHVAV